MSGAAANLEHPIAAARALRSRPGAIFLDSSVEKSGMSLVAADPDILIEGKDWDRLERELQARRRPSASAGYPDGAAIGTVAFDGSFRFAFYDRLHVFLHGPETWIHRPEDFLTATPTVGEWLRFEPTLRKETFLDMVERAKAYIAAGDIYQVCLAHPFVAGPGCAWEYFERLRRCSPAPYSAFLELGNTRIASSSPECFLKMSGRQISTCPIKGTRPRRPDQPGDRRSADDLLSSAKEIAELTMITDLERNDLGQVCEYGSVEVPNLRRLEAFEQVFHLVSTVRGTLRKEITHVQALRHCFPGGSISGAPKRRALEIIRELEPHPRGLYTGAIGYFGYNGESQFSIAIRTAIFEPERTSFSVGAGIVADSVPESEWQETLDKAAGLLLAAHGSSR